MWHRFLSILYRLVCVLSLFTSISLTAHAAADSADIEKIVQELKTIELQINDTSLALHTCGQKIVKQQQELHNLEQQEANLSTNIQEQSKQLADTVYAYYVLMQRSLHARLWQDHSVHQQRMHLGYYRFVQQQYRTALQQSSQQLSTLQGLQQQMLGKQQQLLQQQSLQQQQMLALKQRYSQRQQLLAQQQTHDKISQHATTSLADRITKAESSTQLSLDKQTKYWPLQKSAKHFKYHLAETGRTILPASLGSDVYAYGHGHVVFANWLRGYGLLLIIDHGNGLMSLYGHNQTLFKKEGDWVQGGEVVALVGQSGGHAEAGLYFDIRKNGRSITLNDWRNNANS